MGGSVIEASVRPGERLAFLVVSAYLSAVWLVLLALGRLDPGVSLSRLVRGRLQRRTRGELTDIHAEEGLCFVVKLPPQPVSDSEGLSRVRVFEDDVELGPAHCGHDEIRELGGGRFSHWGDNLYFSTSDDSDPRENGRRYRFAE